MSSLVGVSAASGASLVAVSDELTTVSSISSVRITSFGVSSLVAVSATSGAYLVTISLLTSSTSTWLVGGAVDLYFVPVSVWMKFAGGTGSEAGIVLWGRGFSSSGKMRAEFGREEAPPVFSSLWPGGLSAELLLRC